MDDVDPKPERKREPRLPYRPPRVLETAEFETLALSCSKLVTNPTVECIIFGTSNS
ncbi:MAG: hypothetical protein ACFCGT_06995 [Sandaracinaceae bacterium]